MFEQTFKNIDDVLWKEAGCTTELDYTEQTSWILFLKYLDDLEQERALAADLVSKPYSFIIDKQHRWSKWAAHGNFDHDKALTGDDQIATRHYHDFDPKTGEEFELQDRLLRTGERSFVLMVAGEKPGDPEIAKSLSLTDVFAWLRIVPSRLNAL
jgi:HsdM N-terminal domain